MAIPVRCAQCGRQYAVPVELAGQSGACRCGAELPIPAHAGDATSGAMAADEHPAPESVARRWAAPEWLAGRDWVWGVVATLRQHGWPSAPWLWREDAMADPQCLGDGAEPKVGDPLAEGRAEPIPLVEWEAVAGAGRSRLSACRLWRGLLLGACDGTEEPSNRGKTAAALLWGVLLALTCAVVYRLQPAAGTWADTIATPEVGGALLLLLTVTGFVGGRAALGARQWARSAPWVSVPALAGLLSGGVVALLCWDPGPAWLASLVVFPLLLAGTAGTVALAASQVRRPAVALGLLAGLLAALAVASGLICTLAPSALLHGAGATVRPHGPAIGLVWRLAASRSSAGHDVLGGLLEHEDRATAAQAADWLGKSAYPQAIALLVASARQGERATNMAAVQALGKIASLDAFAALQSVLWSHRGADPVALFEAIWKEMDALAPRLIPQALRDLHSSVPATRRTAMAVLEHGAEPAHLPIAIAGLRDPDAEVRGFATRALQRLKDRRAVPALIAAAADADRGVRYGAIDALAATADPRAVAVLVAATHSPSCWSARRALARIPDPRSARAMIEWMAEEWSKRPNLGAEALRRMPTQAREPLIAAATHPDYRIRRGAIAVLRELYPTDPQARDAAQKGAVIFDAATLEAMVEERREAGKPRADLALRAIRQGGSVPLRVSAEKLLAHLSLDAEREILLGARNDPDARVRAAAIAGLTNPYLRGRTHEAMAEALTDKSPLVRRAALAGVEHRRNADHIDNIVEVFHSDPDAEVRLAAAERLEEWGPSKEDRGEFCQVLLHDPDGRVRSAAARLLGRYHYADAPRAVQALIVALEDPVPAVRQAAREALTNCPDPAAREALGRVR